MKYIDIFGTVIMLVHGGDILNASADCVYNNFQIFKLPPLFPRLRHSLTTFITLLNRRQRSTFCLHKMKNAIIHGSRWVVKLPLKWQVRPNNIGDNANQSAGQGSHFLPSNRSRLERQPKFISIKTRSARRSRHSSKSYAARH